VVNLGSRLCTQAADGQILIDGRVQLAVEAIARTEPIGDLDLKGFHRPVRAFNVRDLMA
jgi:class 3 adenylate cyclase